MHAPRLAPGIDEPLSWSCCRCHPWQRGPGSCPCLTVESFCRHQGQEELHDRLLPFGVWTALSAQGVGQAHKRRPVRRLPLAADGVRHLRDSVAQETAQAVPPLTRCDVQGRHVGGIAHAGQRLLRKAFQRLPGLLRLAAAC